MQKLLKGAKRIRQVLRRRRDKYRLVKGTAGRTDPVLALPQFSSSEMRTSDTGLRAAEGGPLHAFERRFTPFPIEAAAPHARMIDSSTSHIGFRSVPWHGKALFAEQMEEGEDSYE